MGPRGRPDRKAQLRNAMQLSDECRSHLCELEASGMSLACQSLALPCSSALLLARGENA